MCYDFGMENGSEDTGQVLRTAAWLWIGYQISLVCMSLYIYSGRPMQPVLWYHLINAIPALAFLGLAYSKWVRTNLDGILPVMILLISVTPVLLNHWFDLRLPPAPLSNIEGMALRQLPVLFIGLVLVAWHYKLEVVLLYSIGINLFEFTAVSLFGPFDMERLTIFNFLILIRTISFVVVGIFITQLIRRLRLQQDELRAANARLAGFAGTLENLAVSRERNRVARELHDTLAHTLSALAMQLETVKAYWDIEPDTAHRQLAQSITATRTGLDETRRALKALRANPLEDLGLLLALRTMALEMAERARLELELSLPEQIPPLRPEFEQCLYRIAQEALENVNRHACATRVCVRFEIQPAGLSLVIQDDGVGMDLAKVEKNGHYGLQGMRERAQLAGGTVVITSQPNQGTRLELKAEGYEYN